MRAAQTPLAPTGPLVLRIGVVQSGRIVEERIIKQRGAVSIGTSEDATFLCGTGTLPPQVELFARREDGYVLRFDARMSGRVFLGAEVVTLDELRARGLSEVALNDESRGKVVVGETTFLFQFVRPPPPQPRPQLPLAVKGGLANQIDWSLTIIAALSFLLHFGIVGAMYSDWMDVTVDDHHTVAGLVDLMKSIPTPTTTETPPTEEPAETSTTKPAPTSAPQTSAPTSTGKTAPSTSKPGTRSMSSSDAAKLADQASQMEVDLLAGLSGKSSVDIALRRSEIPPVDLSKRAASSEGVAHGGSELHVNSGGPSVAGRQGGLATIAGDVHGNASTNAGETRNIAAPKVDAQIGTIGGGAAVTGADRVIAGLRGRFRACYQKGLNSDSTMSGKVVITAKIGPNGEVSSADVSSSSGLSPEVTSCIAGAIRRAQFDPQPTATTLSVPVSFHHQ